MSRTATVKGFMLMAIVLDSKETPCEFVQSH